MTTKVGILGATGAVGQRLIQLLEPHPDFEIAALTASASSAGETYRDAAKWRVDSPIPASVADSTVRETAPDAVPDDIALVFSSLPSDGDHVGLLEVQRDARGWDGALVKNPNCSTITMVPTLAALDRFGLESVRVSTLQAVSGAGYSGVTSMEIIDNVLPHIGGEEAKMETETTKLLGSFDGSTVETHDVDVQASCNRVPTLDGHLENVWADTTEDVTAEAAAEAMAAMEGADLPSSPERMVRVFEEPDRPQPRLDRMLDSGMAVSAGGIKETSTGIQYDCLAHNTMRGAAGASVLNGELLRSEGYL